MKKTFSLAMSALFIFSLAGCGIQQNKSADIKPLVPISYPASIKYADYEKRNQQWTENIVEDSVLVAINNFAYNTSTKLLLDTGENLNYSPLSLYYALSLAASGANGDTQKELLSALNTKDVTTLNAQSSKLYRNLYSDNEIGKLKIANSLWLGNSMNFKDSFVKNSAENYYASSYLVDFSEKSTADAMSKWVSENTNSVLAPEISVDAEQVLSILNTVYFYDEWSNRFDKTKTASDVFNLSNGEKVNCDFMNQTFDSASFVKGEGFTRALLSLKNAAEMVFILPDAGTSVYSLLSDPARMKETFEGGEDNFGEVIWKMPKFDFGCALDPVDTLKTLGVTSAFEQNADFSGISDDSSFISSIRQETNISIDENGVEAAAFTEIGYAGSAMPSGKAEMILDRPFIYGITATNGAMLFVGVCENPSVK